MRQPGISSLLPGSPALRSGLVEVGDVLQNVDGRDVRGMNPDEVRPLIVGRSGTFVRCPSPCTHGFSFPGIWHVR
eukprot:3488233-Rhodomonas_salina.1